MALHGRSVPGAVDSVKDDSEKEPRSSQSVEEGWYFYSLFLLLLLFYITLNELILKALLVYIFRCKKKNEYFS